MRILQVSFSPKGGAGTVAKNTADLLEKKAGLETQLCFLHPSTLRDSPFYNPGTTVRAALDEYLIKSNESKSMLSVLRSKPRVRLGLSGFDVVHLHWWQGLDLLELRRRNPKAKFVLSLHDDRAFTGGCHSSGTCIGYESGCTTCPITRSPFLGLTRREFLRTRNSYGAIGNLEFVAPTNQMKVMAENSGISKLGKINMIPNPISEEFFGKEGKHRESSRMSFKLGFVAANVADSNKRLSYAVSLIDNLRLRGLDVELEVVGGGNYSSNPPNVSFLGPLSQERLSETASSWAALVMSSKYENSPMTIVEMAALGVPTISHDVGGVQEILSATNQAPIVESWSNKLPGEVLDKIEDNLKSANPVFRSAIRNKAIANFGPDTILQALERVYS